MVRAEPGSQTHVGATEAKTGQYGPEFWALQNMFTDLRKLKRGTGSDPESETAVVLTVVVLSLCSKGYVANEQFNHFSRSCCSSNTLCCVAATFITICSKLTLVHGSSSPTWYLI